MQRLLKGQVNIVENLLNGVKSGSNQAKYLNFNYQTLGAMNQYKTQQFSKNLNYMSKNIFGSYGSSLIDFDENAPLKPAPQGMYQAKLKPTGQVEEQHEFIKRYNRCHGCGKTDDWSRQPDLYLKVEAQKEASRCFKCVDAPCEKGCSTSVDIKSFIYQIEKKNYYGAAKTILTNNPLGLSCGLLCPDSELCGKGCNAIDQPGGVIKIARLQEFAVRMLKEMGLKQIRHPSVNNIPKKDTKIALVGCGPASMSCASFLARLGYENIHVYEKEKFGGGLNSTEIPENRIPFHNMEWEVEQMKQLGVKVFYGQKIDNFKDLKDKHGYEYVFLGNGLQLPKKNIGDIYSEEAQVYNSKTFLPPIMQNVKEGMTQDKLKNIRVSGHVVVIGIGDTALDCARSAFRQGAERVSVVFRRGFSDLRAGDDLFTTSFLEGCNFIPYSTPSKVILHPKTGKIQAVQFAKNLPESNDAKSPCYKQTEEITTLPCDYLVTAFGCDIEEFPQWEVKRNARGFYDMDLNTMRSKSDPWLFAGGDNIGRSYLVYAVSDGKVAAWNIHKAIQQDPKLDNMEPTFPEYMTDVDLVDLSIEVDGIKYENPFGLASAPACTSYPMIKRAFQMGWGFAVVKTFCLDKDAVTNISPRIYKGQIASNQNHAGYANIELISEKTAKYWCEGAKQIKKEFPNKVLIGSAMAGYSEQDWIELTDMCNDAGFDALELNLSCPHGMTEKGMGRSCGENPVMIEDITRWVVKRSKVPVYIKLTPNHGEIEVLAQAAMKGGAAGVTATNTFPSLMDPQPDGTPWPAVGPKKQVAFGGGTGDFLRPIALRKISEIRQNPELKDLSILGTGGVINADHAMSFFNYGAQVIQISSAIMDLDFSLIDDLMTGVKAHLYLSGNQNLRKAGWVGQNPPNDFRNLSQLTKELQGHIDPKYIQLSKIIGTGLVHFEDITKMEKSIYVLPEINNDLCVNCGRCYLACLDSGYQAIDFPRSHVPQIIEEACTGCGLCLAVCPVPDALYFVPRKTPYTVKRGTIPEPTYPKEHLQTYEPYGQHYKLN